MKPQTSNFHVAIITENAAFQDGATGREIARILRNFADAFETRCNGSENFIVRAQDVNGNFCAVADFKPPTDAEPDAGTADVCECGAARVRCECGAFRFECATVCGECGRTS